MGLKVFSRKKSAANNKKVGYEPSSSGQQQLQQQWQQQQVKSRGRYSSQNSVTSRRSLRSLGSNTFGSSKQKKSTTATTGTNYYDDNYQLEIVKQMKSHRDGGNYNNVRAASPDTSEESSFSSNIGEDSWDEAWGDGGGGCGIFDDVGMLNDDDESGDIYSSSNELSTVKSSAPIGIPRLAGCKAWLCVEADNVSFEETTAVSGGGERYDHQGQLDIYASKRGGSVNSLKLRQYANLPRPEKSDHILVKVEVRYLRERRWMTCFVSLLFYICLVQSPHQLQSSQ